MTLKSSKLFFLSPLESVTADTDKIYNCVYIVSLKLLSIMLLENMDGRISKGNYSSKSICISLEIFCIALFDTTNRDKGYNMARPLCVFTVCAEISVISSPAGSGSGYRYYTFYF